MEETTAFERSVDELTELKRAGVAMAPCTRVAMLRSNEVTIDTGDQQRRGYRQRRRLMDFRDGFTERFCGQLAAKPLRQMQKEERSRRMRRAAGKSKGGRVRLESGREGLLGRQRVPRWKAERAFAIRWRCVDGYDSVQDSLSHVDWLGCGVRFSSCHFHSILHTAKVVHTGRSFAAHLVSFTLAQ